MSTNTNKEYGTHMYDNEKNSLYTEQMYKYDYLYNSDYLVKHDYLVDRDWLSNMKKEVVARLIQDFYYQDV